MFIVMIQNAWGRGTTPLAAANNARKAGGKRRSKAMPKPRLVFQYDPKETPRAYVDEYGSICWFGKRPVTVQAVNRSGKPKK